MTPGAAPDERLGALAEVGNIGAGTAATALAQLTGERVEMGVPRVSLVAPEDVPDVVGGGDAVVAAVLFDVVGDAPGRIVVMVPLEAAGLLVSRLTGAAPPDGPDGFDAMGLSALQEVGNVLTSAYLGALATFTGLRMEPTPPAVGVDMAAALIADAVVDVAEGGHRALLVETDLREGPAPQAAALLYIPSASALDAVLARLGVAPAGR